MLRDTATLRHAHGNSPRPARQHSGTRQSSARHPATLRDHPPGRPPHGNPPPRPPPTNSTRAASTAGSNFFDSLFFLYKQEGTGLGGLVSSTCPGQSGTFHLQAGTTYYIQAGSAGFSAGGILHLNVQQIPPPPNDNFANATAISPATLPFADTQIATSATTEPGEPVPSCAPVRLLPNSWWYSFTATTPGSFTVKSTGGAAAIAAYTGTGLATLNQVGCAYGFAPMTFPAVPGTTYYLQVSDYSDVEFVPLTITTTHTYAKDGDYTVSDTVTTQDGRTATTSQVIHIRTHDVAITKFTVPTSVSPGQTRSVTVGISDQRYPETVEVQLLKSNTQGGFDLVGTLTNPVAVQTGNSTAAFTFSYTYTPADAAAGEVTFEAIATVQGARDALPADNTAIAATTVH